MSEYLHVEKPFLDQLSALGWQVIDQGQRFIPSDPLRSLRTNFREWILPKVFRDAVRSINLTSDGKPWLTDRQLDDLRDQILRQPNRTLLEVNEAVQNLFLKAQVDINEVTGESDPVVKLIDFAHPDRNQFHAINQFRVDTPGCVKSSIIPDIVLFVNGLPLVVVEAKIGDPNTANPLYAAYEQLLRYRNARSETVKAGLREGESRLFYTKMITKTIPRRWTSSASKKSSSRVCWRRPPCSMYSVPARYSWIPTQAGASRWCAGTSNTAPHPRSQNACASGSPRGPLGRGLAHPGFG